MTTRHRSTSGVLALVIALGVAMPGSAQLTGLENGEWRYLIGDAGATPVQSTADPDQCLQLRRPGGDLDLAGRQRRAATRVHVAGDPDLRRRDAVHRVGQPPPGRCDRSGDGRDGLDVP